MYDGASFSPRPILSQEDAFVSARLGFSADAAAPEIVEIQEKMEGRSGGRVVIDTTNKGANAGDKLVLDLSELYDTTNGPLMRTMNFEIYSIGTQPFDIEIRNTNGGAAGTLVLHSDMQGDLSLDKGAIDGISLGEGQLLIIYCGDIDLVGNTLGWYYEIRSGL